MRTAARLRLSDEQLAQHLQVIAHATHVQLDTATHLLGGDADAVLEVLEMIAGVHMLSREMKQDEIAQSLDTFKDNVLAFTDVLRKAAAASAARKKPANDNDNNAHSE